MSLRSFFLNLYLKTIKNFSHGKGYGKKNKLINLTVHGIESSLKTNYAQVWAGKMFLHPNDAFRLSIYGIHGTHDFKIIKNNVKDGDNVIDLGANIGYFTLILAKLVGPTGKVFAFEPDPRNLALLKKNVEYNNYKNVIIVPKAVSNVNDKCTLYTGQKTFGQNKIYKPKNTKTQKFIPIDSETVRLDDFFKTNGLLDKISFIKMDIEGAEFLALSGMKEILKLNKNIKIFTEAEISYLEDAGSSYDQFIDLLTENDFTFSLADNRSETLTKVNKSQLEKILNDEGSVNIFCVRELNS
jgi:FkbM family methyltransferase